MTPDYDDEPRLQRPMPPPTVRPVTMWSRRHGGVTSYSLWGRIAATVLLTVLPLWFFVHAGAFGLVGVIMWVFIVLPKALRDVWKRERIVVLPVDRETPARWGDDR
ncbi:MAG: hypothetical protein LC640_10635 [Frankia sp.]|nr:hypothetical protein [Frankia sp.]